MDKVVPTVLIILAIGAFFLYIDPTMTTVQALSDERDRLLEATALADELGAARSQRQAELNEIRDREGDRLERMVPAGRDDARTLMTIDAIVDEHGFSLEDVSVSEGTAAQRRSFIEESDGRYGLKTVNFTVEAPYQEFIDLLQDIEQSLRLFDVVEMSFEGGDEPEYLFSLTLHTYMTE